MKNPILIIILSFLFNSNLFAINRTEITIVGDIKCGKKHIPFATIVLVGTTRGTTADETGHYMMNHLPVCIYKLKAQAIGYISQEKEVVLTKNKTLRIDFELKKDNINLNQVVVSANRNAVNRKDAPVVVSAITPKLLESSGAVCLAEGLNYTPGLRLETNCQNCGFTQVRMNGLEGPYSQILIDSRPVFSGLASVYGLEQIPTSLIQRIEVVRGGGSSLFGGNAIAGTINIITKDPVENTFSIKQNINAIGVGESNSEDVAFDYNTTFNGSIISNDRKDGLFIYGSKRNKEDWDANKDGYSEQTRLNSLSAGFNAFHRFNELNKLTLTYTGIKEERRGGNKLDKLQHEADIAESLVHNINTASISFDHFTSEAANTKLSIYASGQNVDRDSYYGSEMDLSAYGKSKQNTLNSGIQFFTKFDKFLFAPSQFISGVEYTYSDLSDKKLGYSESSIVNNQLVTKHHDNTLISDQKSKTYGVFVQNEWDFKYIKLLLGLRVDSYNIDDKKNKKAESSNTVFVPRTNLLFNLAENIQMRLSYAKGYRAPQIFDEDLHIEVTTAQAIRHKNSDNLEEETSDSFSGSIDFTKSFGKKQLYILTEGFYTKLNNPFINDYDTEIIDGKEGIVSVKKNAPYNATVAGVNLEAKFAFNNNISIQAGFTSQIAEFDEPVDWGAIENYYPSESKQIVRTPKNYGFLVFDWKISHGLELALSSNYTGSMHVPHLGLNDKDAENPLSQEQIEAIKKGDVIAGEKLIKTDSFFDFGAKLSYHIDFSEDVQLEFTGGVKNIFNAYQDNFDKGVYRDAGFIYGPSSPRTIYISVKLGNLF